MKTLPLHQRFGLEVRNVQLGDMTADAGYPEIRDLFERHSLLLFRGQRMNDRQHLSLGRLFGPIEDRSMGANGPNPVVSPISNTDAGGGVIDENNMHVLHLKANQLWHTDSTFLPIPALVSALINFATQRRYVYTHYWQKGDVLIWDERATMHRGRPWPYHEVRTLSSICITAREIDGLESVRP